MKWKNGKIVLKNSIIRARIGESKEKKAMDKKVTGEKKVIKISLNSLPSAQAFKEFVAEYLYYLYGNLFKDSNTIKIIIGKQKWELKYSSSSSSLLQIYLYDDTNRTSYLEIKKYSNGFALNTCEVRNKIEEGSIEEALQVVTEVEKLLYDIYEIWRKEEERLQEVFKNDKRFSKLMEEKLIKKLSGAK